jgi:hypothetical protein
MNPPPVQYVCQRLGPDARLTRVAHWITGREGLTWMVETAAGRSVFKWVDARQWVILRELLPHTPIHTPRLLRSWPGDAVCPPAVEMEFIPHLAAPEPCYRFLPERVPLTDPAWVGDRLESLIDQLARMHARYFQGRGLEARAEALDRCTPDADWAFWKENLDKLSTVANRSPHAQGRYGFWAGQEARFGRTLDGVYEFPLTWYWGDAKWDHIGCRADGQVVVLEWSAALGPPGSDLFLLLSLAPARCQELLDRYLSVVAQAFEGIEAARRAILLGLLRACLIHGPGQATLSIRGFAAGGSTPADLSAWARDEQVTAEAMDELAARLRL